MSKTKVVTYAKRGFWAYDVALGVFVKYLLDAAQQSPDANSPWLSEAVASWKVWAVVSAFGFILDENWSADQRKTFVALAEQACTAASISGKVIGRSCSDTGRVGHASSLIALFERRRQLGRRLRCSLESAEKTVAFDFLKVEPALGSLRSDPRFDLLVQRVGLAP